MREAQRVPNKMDAKRPALRHIVIKMAKVKDKERILKTAREKKLLTYKRVPIRLSADFPKETLQARNTQSHEKQGPPAKIAVPRKDII